MVPDVARTHDLQSHDPQSLDVPDCLTQTPWYLVLSQMRKSGSLEVLSRSETAVHERTGDSFVIIRQSCRKSGSGSQRPQRACSRLKWKVSDVAIG